MFPQADLFCLVGDATTMTPRLRRHKLTTSFLQHVPGSRRWYRHLLPLHPFALERLDLSGYDLILSSESGPAKGVFPSQNACHICYCHSPMRYLWDLYPAYRRSLGPVAGTLFSLVAPYLRRWDRASASRVHYFVANSHNVASRIRNHFGRDSHVIHPPVNVTLGYISGELGDYYLVVSRLIDYKRVDLAVEACNQLNRPLRIVGDGNQLKKLRGLAGPTIQFLGRLDDEAIREQYAHCRALLFPGEEDFGIVPVEAQSFGRPVIAYGRGGVLETVQGIRADNALTAKTSTGVFFQEQTTDSLVAAIRLFESVEAQFSPASIQNSVQRFAAARFTSEMHQFIDEKLKSQRTATVATLISSNTTGPVVCS
jgi:glycosyltransferase involved in cell wall biosynthesis